MTEVGKESPKIPSTFIQTVSQMAEDKLALVEKYTVGTRVTEEEITKISTNVKHFLHCLALIPPEEKTKIKSPAELIDALNEVTKKEKKPPFFRQGETFFHSALRGTLKIINILPPGPVDLSTEKGFYSSGINLLDDTSFGSRFTPCNYFFEQVTAK